MAILAPVHPEATRLDRARFAALSWRRLVHRRVTAGHAAGANPEQDTMQPIRSLLIGAALVGAVSAQTLVVPAAAAATDGNSSSGWPFDVAAARLLYIYDSTHFTSNGVNFPILINQISWRANTTTTTWTGSTGTVQLDLSTAPIDHSVISATWSANHGVDQATVYSGALTIGPGSGTAGVPGPFHVTLTFTTPFLYDPNAGDLTIDTIHSGLTIANTPTMDMVTTAGVALARRVSSIANPPAATGTIWTGEAANVLEFGYTPAAGLYAGFTANVTGGTSPLAVTFSDQSFSSAPGGVTSWAWDFNGDAVTDSTLQNPTFVYTTCGNFDVALTVNDGVNPPSTLTRTAYVRTDDITAGFTTQVIGPLTVQFTDTSNPPATAWAWDFDGDTIIDSTLPNPVRVFPNTVPANVTLTATRNCKSDAETQLVVPLQQLTTGTAGGTLLSSGATFYLDVQVLNPAGVNINAMDVMGSAANTAFTIDVYLKQGSYIGSELTAAAWTRVGQATGTTGAVATVFTTAVMTQTLHIPQGTYGMALRYVGAGPRYATGSLTTYGNADLSITTGASAATYTAPFVSTSAVITPRVWAGRVYYGSHNVTGTAGYGFFGQGCPGTLGITNLSGTQPQLGSTLAVTMNNLPFAAALMITGVSNTISSVGPLPVDLTILGMPGCAGRVSLDLTDFVVGVGTAATWNITFPNNPVFSGLLFYNQAFVLDPAANAFGFVTSDAAGMVLGN
jgi:PKD repeat protein